MARVAIWALEPIIFFIVLEEFVLSDELDDLPNRAVAEKVSHYLSSRLGEKQAEKAGYRERQMEGNSQMWSQRRSGDVRLVAARDSAILHCKPWLERSFITGLNSSAP